MNQDLIFNSTAMKEIYERSKKIASYPATVLICGETGVGKEVIANLIHKSSPRANMPFIKINCGAIPESLLESELFGYERGAFTGANREGSTGLFESAHKGSLLLDEIGELSQTMQVKLLRVLQEREIRRIGGSWSKAIDVRIIASTNKNLWNAVNEGSFRMDLFYRLNLITINIPPLRERREDILPLLEYFLQQLSLDYNDKKKFDINSLSIIKNHNFYGNVRELRNIVEAAYINSDQNEIRADSLPDYLSSFSHSLSDRGNYNMEGKSPLLANLVDSYEKDIITRALSSNTSIRKAAAQLGISNATMLRKIKYHKLEVGAR